MVSGAPGEAGQSVPRPVVEELKKGQGTATPPHNPMVGNIARGNLWRSGSAIRTNVSY